MTDATTAIDTMWVLGCTAAVFLMQAGFCCLESGLVRAKNSINVAIKNLIDICVSACVFWLVGFGIMFGASSAGLYGTSGFCFESASVSDSAFFLFQVAFCGTAATIVSGAVAERMRFTGYVLVTIVVSGLIYPVSGHWAWGGFMSGNASGWLEQLGYIDFAGSSVVHAVGGSVALAAILIIGPRQGRFDGDPRLFHGHNLPMSALGVLILWVGWFGFNGGSTLAMTDLVPQIMINTGLGAAAGGVGTLAIVWLQTKRTNVYALQNGILAGLVSVTACCHVIGPGSAILIGVIGGWIAAAGTQLMERLRLDDVVGAIPVHAGAGIWGVLAVALFGAQSELAQDISRWDQFLVQLIGIGAIGCWSFTAGFGSLWLINRFVPLRVTAEEERVGLNVSEHDASYELLDLLTEMETQRQTGDFTQPSTIVSETEVGQIAAQYNRVLDTVNDDRAKLQTAHRDLESLQGEHLETARYAGMAEIATGVLHNVGNVLNGINVSTNLLHERLVSNRVDNLQKALTMLEEHSDDPGAFLTEDEKGRRLPAYLRRVSETLPDDQQFMQEEVGSLSEKVEHIKEIVQVQQDYALRGGHLKTVELSELVETALRVNDASLERHGIEIVREFCGAAPLVTDKHKVLQILVNLISNAKNAIDEHDGESRRLTLRIADDRGSACIEVCDTGMGIASDNLDRVFGHGFTTREKGHGFGLHSSANAATELGGALTVHSDGPGCGATFTLQLPMAEDSPCPAS